MKKLMAVPFTIGLVLLLTVLFGTEVAYTTTYNETYKKIIKDQDCKHQWTLNESGSYNKTYDNGDKLVQYDCTECGSIKLILRHNNIQEYTTPAKYSSKVYSKGSTGVICKNCSTSYTKVSKTWTPAVKMTLSGTQYTYTGKAIKPKVTVKDYKGKTISPKYYSVKYQNNTKPGKASVTVTMKTLYKGTFKDTFTILPKKATLTSVSYTGTAAIKVKWEKIPGVSKYAVEYSTDSSFSTDHTCTVLVSSTAVSTTIRYLNQTTYYVRVAGVTCIGDGNYYGQYSAKKTVKVKTGASVKQMINAIGSTTKYYKYIKKLTNNEVDIRNYKTTYSRMCAVYSWFVKNQAGFYNCLECNWDFGTCVYYLTYGSKSYDNWIRIAGNKCKRNNGTTPHHKWCVLVLQGTEYIFDPRMQGKEGFSTGYSYFGQAYDTEIGKKYYFSGWEI